MSMERRRIIESNIRNSNEYLKLVDEFIEIAREHARKESCSGMRCPCKVCKNDVYLGVRGLRSHLIVSGFEKTYTTWIWHGEDRTCSEEDPYGGKLDEDMDYDERLNDLANDVARHFVGKPKVLEAMYNDKQTPLYEGSRHTVLSATLMMMNLKAKNGLTNKAMTETLLLFKDILPKDNLLPDRDYAAKRILCPMGMELEKIHACPNDCMLYREGDDFKRDTCRVCNEPRYKPKCKDIEVCGEIVNKTRKQTPAKVVWYLPIIPRLQRLFANPEDAKNMTWHSDRHKPCDDVIRHTSDGDQWKKIDELFPDFKEDPRNVRLGLSTDGMNPYGDMSSSHSSWPVMVVLYNIPSWLTMKRKYVLLSLMISGPKQPGNDIDVYLAPLIDDLKKLWYNENWTYDGYREEWFKLRGMLFCTINDFPALGNLSGYPVKGHFACPVCEKETCFTQLKHGRKTVYLGHRRFLPGDHPFRQSKKWFTGMVEKGEEPKAISGFEIFEATKHIENDFGKNRKKPPIVGCWKKFSIFFDLPYWVHLDVRHCLDVMHIEKNVCDSLIGTLLNTPGKTKDGLKARLDMQEMSIRPDLAPITSGGKTFLPPAPYSMSQEEKRSFCECLKGIKVPTTFSSNISRCVNVEELKLAGLKSHDCHTLMQDLNIIALRSTLPSHVRMCISRLCFFFKSICRKNVSRARLDKLQIMVVEVLCRLEMYFPPSFFDIMVHLIVHLVREIKCCGPVFLRWMYPFERYMKIFKCFVKNRYRPDASIVQRYVAEEAIEFCTAYLDDVDTIGIPIGRHVGRIEGHGLRSGVLLTPPAEDMNIAHLYVLRNHKAVVPYIELHMDEIRVENPGLREHETLQQHTRTFARWLRDTVEEGDHSEDVKWLSRRPLGTVWSYGGYDVNGYTFGTKSMDEKGVSQNSGVSLVSDELQVFCSTEGNSVYADTSFFGTITGIWELNYVHLRVVVFKCEWVDPVKGTITDPLGFTLVDRRKLGYIWDPFILATQADQVFYVKDPADRHMEIVLKGKKTFLGTESSLDCLNDVDHVAIEPLVLDFKLDENDANLRKYQTRSDHSDGIWLDDKGNVRKRKFKMGKLKKLLKKRP